jgi:DNA adenine methylase
MGDLTDFFEEFSKSDYYEPIKAPFVWVGGKGRFVGKILPHLPYSEKYVEPFGGSMSVLLARSPSAVEVYNDRYSGVVDFYRCLRDPELYNKLIERIELTVHGREMFSLLKEERSSNDPVIRAAAWYYIQQVSFGGVGRCYGRSLGKGFAGRYKDKLPHFEEIHKRLRNVQIENMDWRPVITDWDSEDTVFYIDPPYIGTDTSMYGEGKKWEVSDLHDLLDTIFSIDGFVAMSGYPLDLIDIYPWSDRIEWDASVTVSPVVGNERNQRIDTNQRNKSTEVLWIKDRL